MTTFNFLSNSDSVPNLSLEGKKENSLKVNPLRRRLLLTILPAVLMPLVVASAIGFSITERRIKEDALSQLQDNTILTSEAVSVFIRDSFTIPDLVAIDPSVVEAMRVGAKKAQAESLAQQPIEILEKKFAATKLLEINTNLNNYLKGVIKTTQISEIFFTERNGFNLAYSNPTSDFVQRDENWWQTSQKNGRAIDDPEFDDSANAVVIALSKAVQDPNTGEFLGVIKAGIPVTNLNSNITKFLSTGLTRTQTVQVIDARSETLVNTITQESVDPKQQQLIGDKPIFAIAKTILEVSKDPNQNSDRVVESIEKQAGFADVVLKLPIDSSQSPTTARLQYRGKVFSFATVPNTDLVAIASVDTAEIDEVGRNLLNVFALTALSLGTLSLILLGYNFNNLIDKVQQLLQQQKQLTEEQREQKENLEKEIFLLLDEVSPATEGDLTVRASLSSLEISTIADLFNAIIDSLQEIAIEVKQSTGQVSSSLQENEAAIRLLSEEAIKEAEETRNTLSSVEAMSQTIWEVATNASQAATIADDTYSTVRDSTNAIEQTADNIISLRNTVGETAKKMKRLGESSQKISQVVSLIEEIALKTNLLAINASVEASRAGEQGQGFSVVAEQVGMLAEQSAAATKEIAQIVASIQMETQEVTQAMETGTAQVVDTTRSIESTKKSLGLVLQKSQEINQLMRSISQATVSQANTSQTITGTIQQMTQLSEQSSISSKNIAQSMLETAQVAQKLESTVAKFKVTAD